MSYADDKTEKDLLKLEKKLSKEYSRAYFEMEREAQIYFKQFKERYDREYKKYMAGEYTEDEFKRWYKTQVARGKRYEKMVDDMAKRATNTNEVACSYINDTTPSIYSLNRNFSAYEIAQVHPNTSFEIVNEQTVKNLMTDKDNVTEFRTVRVNPKRDYEWNSKEIKSALTSGILRGVSIDELASSFMVVMRRNRAAAVRNARTAVTSAQNAGRLDTMTAAEDMGIQVKKRWHSMEDANVRHTHAMLNGQIRDKDKPFGNGLMYPGDSKGAPAEVYNCRCRMEYVLPKYMDDKGTDYYDRWEKLSPEQKKEEERNYNAWMAAEQKKEQKYLADRAAGKKVKWEGYDEYKLGVFGAKDKDEKVIEFERVVAGWKRALADKKLFEDCSLNQYIETYYQAKENLVGLLTPDGMRVNNISVHLTERIIGGPKREPTSIDIVKNVLTGHGTVKIYDYRVNEEKGDSQTYWRDNYAVSFNVKTGTIIQANPKHTEPSEKKCLNILQT